MDLSKLLYLPLDIENPPLDSLDHLNNLDFKKIYQDDYRDCYAVPLMYDFKPGKFTWTPFAFPYQTLREWFEDILFPLLGKSRIVIITTPEGGANVPHIDCDEYHFHNSLQHKFRYVMQGNIDDLYFMTDHGDIQMPGGVDKPFVMSGSWPHYMTNTYKGTKFTLAYGAPWDGSLEDPVYKNLLERSYVKYSEYYLSMKYGLPENWDSLFQKEYDFRTKAKKVLKHPKK